MIETWISEGIEDPRPSWRLLVEAVAASHGGQDRALAEQLAKQHTPTGSEDYNIIVS